MNRNVLSLGIGLALSVSAVANAQEAQPASNQEETKTLEAVKVVETGSRAPARTVNDSMTPIDLLGEEELQNAGTPELQAVLTRQVPSFNFPRTSITDGSDVVRPSQLRGLSPDQTLVLINGKRRHRTAIINVNGTLGRGSSPVDLNAIPTSAIRSIEVLRDGAAAQYGSDAIAGVININLKKNNEGGDIVARWGEYSEGDGELNQISASVGFGLGAEGFMTVSAEYRDKGFTNRTGPDFRQQYPLVAGARDPREATFNRFSHRFGDAETTDRALFINTEIPFSDNASFYAFGGYSKRDGESAGFYRRALDARNIPAIYPNGFLPLIVSDVRDRSLVAGFRGLTANQWEWDLSVNFGGSDFDFNVENSLNVQLGPTSQRNFFAGTLRSSQDVFNADFNRAFDVTWLDSPLYFAFGAEYRRENFQIKEGEPASYFGTGSQVFPGFKPTDASDNSRNNWSVYLDAEGNLTEAWNLGLAARYENYSDFGNTTSGKLSTRYKFSDQFALRASASTGFHAPNLQQQFYSTTATNFIGGVPFDIRTFPVTDPVAIALGAEPLKAETSTNYSVGMVFDPSESFSASLDFYRIDIDDRIVLSENLTGAAVTAFLVARGINGVTGGRYFTNAIDTRTRGVDLTARYRHTFDNDFVWTATFGYNRNDTDITRVAPNPPQLTTGGLNLQRIGRVEIGRFTVGSPKDKIVVGSDFAWKNFTAQLTATRYGQWQVLNTNSAFDDTFSADWVTDLSVSYKFKQFTATVGAENITDKYPDEVTTVLVPDANGFLNSGVGDNSFSGILPYARGEAPYGFNGRFVYVKLGYSW